MPNRVVSLSKWLGLGSIFFFLALAASAQTVDETEKQLLHGDYDKVIEITRKKVAQGAYQDAWRIMLIKSLMATGRYAEAHTNAAAVAADSYNLSLHLLARETAMYQNDSAGVQRELSRMKMMIERRFADFQNDDAPALGQALLLLGVEPRLVLDNCFRPAERVENPPRDAFLDTGNLALEKHDYAMAADAFQLGLKKFPNDPDMESGLAKAFESGDQKEMLQHLEASLEGNPHQVSSLLMIASRMIDAEEYEQAEEQLAAALKVNPHCPEAWAYRAVLAKLRNDTVEFEKDRQAALEFWRSNPEVDYLIGQKLARKYRFDEAAAEQKHALEFSPTYLPARRELSEDLLRLGRESEGWDLAQDAHNQDSYDVTLYNLVKLHDQMTKYQTLTNADFAVRMTAHEAALYGDRVLDLLNRAKATLSAKYGVTLTNVTQVEIFPEQKDFAVRTFGMPGNPGYLGVCFGSVITANSPASQEPNPANWEDVLWHEFCHVITLTDTRNRMPRWLSEGISVYEERQANPTWGERMNLAYREMIREGKLTPISRLSGAFLSPKSSEDLLFAYYECSLVVEFLVQQHGFDTLKSILQDLRDGKEINESIAARTMPMANLELKFSEFAREKANALAPKADLQKPPAEMGAAGEPSPIDEDTLFRRRTGGPAPAGSDPRTNGSADTWNMAHANNYYSLMSRARGFIEDKNWAAAKPLLAAAADAYSGERRAENPLWLLAVTERNLFETNAEYATLQRLAEHESDFVDLYRRLIDIGVDRKDWQSVAKYAQLLLQVDPLIPAPYEALGKAGDAMGQRDLSIAAYQKMLLLDPPDPAEVHFQLARLLHARGGAEAEAKRHVLQALEDTPRFREAQLLLLEIEGRS